MSGRITMARYFAAGWHGQQLSDYSEIFCHRLAADRAVGGFFQTYLFDSGSEFILAGDATTVTKSDRQTHRIDRFFFGVIGKVVSGLEFFVFSSVDVRLRKSYPLAFRQTLRTKNWERDDQTAENEAFEEEEEKRGISQVQAKKRESK